MISLQTVGHRGHGIHRILVYALGVGVRADMHDKRVGQLCYGKMTGGNQPTNIRGIDRRMKVPGGPLFAFINSRDPPKIFLSSILTG